MKLKGDYRFLLVQTTDQGLIEMLMQLNIRENGYVAVVTEVQPYKLDARGGEVKEVRKWFED